MKRILLFFLLLVGMATAGNAQTKIIMGDMNRDETITIADVTNLVNVLLGKSEMQYITRADFGKPVTGITIDQTSLTLGEGGTATLTATVVPADAGDTGVIWTSSNPSVATVSSGNGQCELYLESYGSTKIAVIKAVMAITGWALADAKALVEGELPASLGIFEAATAADHKATLEEAGATVTLIDGGTGGEVTAHAPGTAVITATTVDGGYTATCTVTVLSGSFVAVTGVGLSASSITIQLDLLHFPVLNVTVQPEDATNKNVSWSSSDESVAHVEAVSFNQCYLVPEGEGTATITATTEDGGYTATCEVTVERSTGIWLDVEYVDLLLGNQFTITATVMTADGTNPGLVWSSSNESVVAITNVLENTATIQGNKTGTATITAATEDGSYTDACTVTVRVPATGITIATESLSLPIGDSFTLEASVQPSNATNQNIMWSSSNTHVATVSSDGIVTATGDGTATITAKTEDGSFTATCEVTVTVPVTAVVITNSMLSLHEGETFTIEASVRPTYATNKNIIWSSSDPSVATVSSSGATGSEVLIQHGLVTAVGGGTATITATSEDGGVATICEVTVTVPVISVTGVTLDKTNLYLARDETSTLTATVQPDDATNKNIIWSSSNTAVAEVSENGLVTAINLGQTLIRATTEDGRFSASCVVTVTYDYVDMGDGLLWATCNVGANSPEQYGDYFAWGETEPKEDYSWATYKFMLTGKSDWRYITKYQTADGTTGALWYYDGIFTGDGKTELDPEDDAATVNWGEGWRMPTMEEWENLKDTNKFVWTWTTDYNGTGVKGYTVTSKAPGYVGNQIFLPAAGIRDGSSLSKAGSSGEYWSRTLESVFPYGARILYFDSSYVYSNYMGTRARGLSVRPVRVAE